MEDGGAPPVRTGPDSWDPEWGSLVLGWSMLGVPDGFLRNKQPSPASEQSQRLGPRALGSRRIRAIGPDVRSRGPWRQVDHRHEARVVADSFNKLQKCSCKHTNVP